MKYIAVAVESKTQEMSRLIEKYAGRVVFVYKGGVSLPGMGHGDVPEYVLGIADSDNVSKLWINIDLEPIDKVCKIIDRRIKQRKVTGLGDLVHALAKAVGVKHCCSCERRRLALNKAVPFGRRK